MFESVLKFWFEEIESKQWWVKDDVFDHLIADRFGKLHRQAGNCELYRWRDHAKGRLAEIIVLDQFSRNIHRDTALAFINDTLTLALAQEAVRLNVEKDFSAVEKSFLYMPYMHSESLAIHEVAAQLFSAPGLEYNYKFELKHKEIIERFGRYPHRNKLLGRKSTAEEEDFLKQPGSSF
jgi:uncharacterized protein (DUF924 family)